MNTKQTIISTIIICFNFASLLSLPRTPAEVRNIQQNIKIETEKKLKTKFAQEKDKLNKKIENLRAVEKDNFVLQRLIKKQEKNLFQEIKKNKEHKKMEAELLKTLELNLILKKEKMRLTKEIEQIQIDLNKKNQILIELQKEVTQSNLSLDRLGLENKELQDENQKIKQRFETANQQRESHLNQILQHLPKEKKEKSDLQKLQAALGKKNKLSESYNNLMDKLLTRTLEILIEEEEEEG